VRSSGLLLGLVAAAGFAPPSTAMPDCPPVTRQAIHLEIVNAATGEPVAQAVAAIREGRDTVRHAADRSGRLTLDSVSLDGEVCGLQRNTSYPIEVLAPGYYVLRSEVVVRGRTEREVALEPKTAGILVPPLDEQLARRGTGQRLDVRLAGFPGYPCEGAAVAVLLKKAGASAWTVSWPVQEDGTAHLYGEDAAPLELGTSYVVSVRGHGYDAAPRHVTWERADEPIVLEVPFKVGASLRERFPCRSLDPMQLRPGRAPGGRGQGSEGGVEGGVLKHVAPTDD